MSSPAALLTLLAALSILFAVSLPAAAGRALLTVALLALLLLSTVLALARHLALAARSLLPAGVHRFHRLFLLAAAGLLVSGFTAVLEVRLFDRVRFEVALLAASLL